jgi:hypothetical protein
MSLYQQIRDHYPQLTDADFSPFGGTILLQNDSDGLGDYIKAWNNPLPHPPFGYDPHAPKAENE